MNRFFRTRLAGFLWLAGACLPSTGCVSFSATHAVPVCEWNDPSLWQGYRDALVPVDYGVLSQPKPIPRLFATGDLISVYIEGILPSGLTQIPVFERAETFTQIYYPPEGSIRGPSFGVPLEVSDQGTITLPFLGEFPVAGKSLVDVSRDITRAYSDRQILKPGRERTSSRSSKKVSAGSLSSAKIHRRSRQPCSVRKMFRTRKLATGKSSTWPSIKTTSCMHWPRRAACRASTPRRNALSFGGKTPNCFGRFRWPRPQRGCRPMAR